MKFVAKQIPEGINTSSEHPLKELFILLAGVGLLVLAAFLLLMTLSDYLVRFIPLEIEQQWFNSSRLDFIQQQDQSPEAIAVEKYLQKLVQQLNDSQAEKINFSIQLIDSDVPNAFITPGGHIFVTAELLRYVNSENALAMVIAHEMAHQYHRHPIRSMGRGIVIAVAFMMFAGVDGSEWVTDILANSINLGLLAYSRDQEREADKTGLELLTGYYGHPAGSSYFFQQLNAKDEFNQSGLTEYLSTHPNTIERVEYLSQFDSDKYNQQVPLPASVHRLLESLNSSKKS